MSMKMVCNRCNKVKEDGEHFNHLNYISYTNSPEESLVLHYENSEYDLCPECSKLFGIFMDGGEVEEDRYKDCKPSAVVIHKLANGNYGIENVPEDQAEFDDWLQMVTDDPEKKKNHCGTCAYQWNTAKCPRAKEISGTISCENDAEACDEWTPAVMAPYSMDKEESDLSVESHTNVAGVTVPDSEPWSSIEGRKKDKTERCFG